MSLWVKICGNTSLEDAQVAADARADAVGFIFAPSPRRVTVEQVAAIVPGLPANIEKIGVFVNATPNEIEEAVRRCRLTGVQLHSEIGAGGPMQLRAKYGSGFRILRVVHFEANVAESVIAIAGEVNVDGILIDSKTLTAVGGTGVRFNWAEAAATILQNAGSQRLIVAGGLTRENVAEAVATLHPWGVDVASGVEAAPGRKDSQKVRDFVANARAAGQLL